MKKLYIITLLVAATAVSHSQDTRTIPMLLTAREQKAVEADRVHQMQYIVMHEIQKVNDTNKLAQITASIIAAQTKTNVVQSPSN